MTRADQAAEPLRVTSLRSALAAESSDSALLERAPHNNPVCSIELDRKRRRIVLVWKRYATSLQLRFIHEWMLHQIERHQLEAILGDDSAVPTLHAADGDWIAHDWMPRASAAGLRRIATKIPERHFGRVAARSVHAAAPSALEIRTFDAVSLARQWLEGPGLTEAG